MNYFFLSSIDVAFRVFLGILDRTNLVKVVPESVSSQIRAHPVARSCKSRGSCTRVRYRLHLHKAIVFPLLRTRLPRTWRGCHSEFLRTLSSVFSRSAADQYFTLSPSRHFLLLSPFFLDFKPPCSMQAPIYTPSFATMPAFLHTITPR